MLLKTRALVRSRMASMNAGLSACRSARNFSYTTLYKNTNQAKSLAEYAINFMAQDHSKIDPTVYDRVRLFHTDSIICGISALAMKTNAPNLLRREAIGQYSVSPNVKGKVHP